MPAAMLLLLFLAQQILLPNALDGWRCEDIVNARRKEGHGLKLVLKLSGVFGRSNLLFILIVLTLYYLLNPLNNTKQVAS
jgi:hypothetical protein